MLSYVCLNTVEGLRTAGAAALALCDTMPSVVTRQCLSSSAFSFARNPKGSWFCALQGKKAGKK